MSFPRYQRYKGSGVKWLGNVPEHWRILPIKAVVSTRVTDGPHETPEFLDEGVPFVSAEAVAEGYLDLRRIRGFISAEDHCRYSIKYIPRRDDIFMVKSGATTGVTAIVETDEEFNIWSPLAAIRCNPKSIRPRYILHCLRSRNFKDAVALNWSFGTQQNIGMGVVENLRIPVPPLPEQLSIASLLDYETAKIDALIDEQHRLTELLKEKCRATISHVVTKGLDPNAPMKDSGVDWIGKIPTHWELGPVKRWFRTASGGTPDTKRAEYYCTDKGFPWIRTTDLNNDRLSVYEEAITEEGMAASACTLLPEQSVLIAMYGGSGTIGKNALLQIRACVNQAVCALLPCASFIETFTFRYAQFYRPFWMVGAESSRIDPNISQQLIRNSPIVCPPLEEQARIVDVVERQLSQLSALEQEAERAIAVLVERRTALISAAVTGKIDVRNYTPRESPHELHHTA